MMGIFRSTKGIVSKMVDVRVDKWISLDHIKDSTKQLYSIVKSVMIPARARYSETFEEALIRLNLNEQDILERKHEFTRLLTFFIVLAFLVMAYGLYLSFLGTFLPALITFCLSFYCLTQAFRFHFWLFQIKHRKLGCTLKEWFNSSAHTKPSYPIVAQEEEPSEG